MCEYIGKRCVNQAQGDPQTLDPKSPIKLLGVLFGIFRDLFWGPKKKVSDHTFLRAISWDPLENRSGANRTKKHQRSASEPGAERQGKGVGTAMSPLTTYIPPYIVF
jgi:hypothetical protein